MLHLIAVTGCATALLAAAIAVTQTDLKRVLAYSTVSQLGYMFMALGSGVGDVAQLAVVAAHVSPVHARLFQGSLVPRGRQRDARDGGRHRHAAVPRPARATPSTHVDVRGGALALSGIFPLSGFFSKDEILLAIKLAAHEGGFIYVLVYWVAVFTAFLTAFYTGRAYFMTFWGELKLPGPDDPEAPPAAADARSWPPWRRAWPWRSRRARPWVSCRPRVAYRHDISAFRPGRLHDLDRRPLPAGRSVLGDQRVVRAPSARHFRFRSLKHEEHHFDWITAIVGTLAGVGGIYLSFAMYAGPSALPGRLAERLRPLYEASVQKFQVDEFYGLVIVRPTRALAVVCEFLDTYLVDRLVRGIAGFPRFFGRALLARYQNGLIQNYASVSALRGVSFLCPDAHEVLTQVGGN